MEVSARERTQEEKNWRTKMIYGGLGFVVGGARGIASGNDLSNMDIATRTMDMWMLYMFFRVPIGYARGELEGLTEKEPGKINRETFSFAGGYAGGALVGRSLRQAVDAGVEFFR